MNELTFDDIKKSHQRIKNYIKNTPTITNEKLNRELGAEIFLKLENLQQTNAFKARGAFNALLAYREEHGEFPKKVVAQSSGNHAQAMAYACKKFGIEVIIYMINSASKFKINATKAQGATVILCDKRSQAIENAKNKAKEGYFYIHPADGDYIISGQGTATFESLSEIGEVNAIFAPLGGGGLISGCYLASTELSKNAKIFGCEPINGNDAARSLKSGKIFTFKDSPNTSADGARTLGVSKQAFHYLKKITGILEISEEEITNWQTKLSTLLKMRIEPTSSLSIAGIKQYLDQNPKLKNQKFLAIISGGNIKNN